MGCRSVRRVLQAVRDTYKDELVVFAVEVVEMVPPEVLGISRIHEAMAVLRSLDEHMRWQVLTFSVSDISGRSKSYLRQDTSLLGFRLGQSVDLQRVASSSPWPSSYNRSWSRYLRSSNSRVDSRGGSCCDRTQCRMRAAVRHLRGLFPTYRDSQRTVSSGGFWNITMAQRFLGEACQQTQSTCDMFCLARGVAVPCSYRRGSRDCNRGGLFHVLHRVLLPCLPEMSPDYGLE